jgi:hypothetical protein
MPWDDHPQMRSMRLAYNAALSAHSACARVVSEAVMRGEQPTASMLGAEAAAKVRLQEARAKLHAAMAKALGGPVR